MRYSQIRAMDISNGEGIGISLFVQGCHFHCKGCFNKETWDFNGGKEWDKNIENKFLELAGKPHIQRISFLGGEPLADENVGKIFELIRLLKIKYPQKNIWIYTGYLWENITKYTNNNPHNITRLMSVSFADVVVDGQFQLENQDLYNRYIVWAGSTNQRVIDSYKSISCGQIQLHSKN